MKTGGKGAGVRPKDTAIRLRTILAPTDLSDHSLEALPTIIALAKTFGARLILLHVFEPSPCDLEFSYYACELNSRKRCAAEQDRLKELGNDLKRMEIRTSTVSRVGPPGEMILEESRRLHPDVIVIASRGHFALPDACESSITETLLQHAPCPVLVLRDKEFVTPGPPSRPRHARRSGGSRGPGSGQDKSKPQR